MWEGKATMNNPTGTLELELGVVLNRYSAESGSNTPDFILAKYLTRCLEAYNEAANRRDGWYGISPKPGANFMNTNSDAF